MSEHQWKLYYWQGDKSLPFEACEACGKARGEPGTNARKYVEASECTGTGRHRQSSRSNRDETGAVHTCYCGHSRADHDPHHLVNDHPGECQHEESDPDDRIDAVFGCSCKAYDEIDTTNHYRVTVMCQELMILALGVPLATSLREAIKAKEPIPPLHPILSKRDALNLAAWLVALADDEDQFQHVLDAVKST